MKFNRFRFFSDSKRIFLGGIALLCLNGSLCAATIAAGNKTALYTSDISEGGDLFGWGANGSGQIGDGTQEDRLTPVASSEAGPWLTVATNLTGISDSTLEGHGLAIKADGAGATQGTLWAWGDNSRGQLGQGDTTNRLVPTQIGSASNWVAVEAGSAFSMALNENGEIYVWGDNRFGQLGAGVIADFQSTPTKLKDKDGTSTNNDKWISIAAGADYALAVHELSPGSPFGYIYGWGRNSVYQLGLGHNSSVPAPTRIPGSTFWRTVEAGFTASFAIDSNYHLYSWGQGAFGGLGLGANQDTSILSATSPTREATNNFFNQVSVGSSHTLALTTSGILYGTGQNASGQLGISGNQLYNKFQYITGGVSEIAAGKAFSMIVLNDGSVLTAGSNDRGQLGNGTTSAVSSFTPTLLGTVDLSIDSISITSAVDALGAGDTLDFQVILRNNGTGIVENADLESLAYQVALSPALIFSAEGEADLVNFALAANPFPDFATRADAEIGPSEAISVSFTAEIPSPIYQGDYNLLFEVNPDLSFEESNTDNNFITSDVENPLQFRADLQIEILSPIVAPAAPISSTGVYPVRLSITNHGTGSIAAGDSFSYRLFLSEYDDEFIGEIYELAPYDDELTPAIDYDFVIDAAIAANPALPLTEVVQVVIPEEINLGLSYFVGAVVDSDLDIEESDETNNSDFTSNPIITIQGVSLSEALDITVGAPILTTAGDANWFGVPSIEGADTPALFGDAAQSPSLDVGESGSLTFSYPEPRAVTFRWKANTTSPLNRLFFGENGNPIDPEDRTISPYLFGNTAWQEVGYIIPKDQPVGLYYEQGAAGESNRVFVDQLVVSAPIDKPDYVIDAIEYEAGDYVLQRDQLTVTVRGRNRGADYDFSGDDFRIKVWLSRDTSGAAPDGDANDVLLGDLSSFQILDNGSRFVYKARFTLPKELMEADYYVLARVDSEDEITEYTFGGGAEPVAFTPEDNNWEVSDTAGVGIRRLPDLWVTNLDGNTDFPIDFDSVESETIFVAGPTDVEGYNPLATESQARVLAVFIKEPLIDDEGDPIRGEMAIRFDLVNRGWGDQTGQSVDIGVYFAEARDGTLSEDNLVGIFTEDSGFATDSGRTYELTTNIPENVVAGRFYYVVVVVDPENLVEESDEDNNSSSTLDNDVFIGEVPLEVALNDNLLPANIATRSWDEGYINSFLTGGRPTSPWFGQTSVYNNDSTVVRAAAQSGPVASGETSYMTTDILEEDVEFPVFVSFRWKINGGLADSLKLEVRERDGLPDTETPLPYRAVIPSDPDFSGTVAPISGFADWRKVSFIIETPGNYRLRWMYEEFEDGVLNGTAWVDSFSLESPDLVVDSVTIANGLVGLDGGDTFDLSFDVRNDGDGRVNQAAVQVRLVKNISTLENTDWTVANFQDVVLVSDLNLDLSSGEASFDDTITLPNGMTDADDFFVAVWVDYTNVIPERDEANNLAFSEFTIDINPSLTLEDALDTGTTIDWSLTGDGRWFPVNLPLNVGDPAILVSPSPEDATNDALQSPEVILNEQASFEAVVIGPQLLSFWWRAVSPGADTTNQPNNVQFRLNGQSVSRELDDAGLPLDLDDASYGKTVSIVGGLAADGGDSGWRKETVLIPSGAQVLSWTYTHQDPNDPGNFWVDKIELADISEAEFAISSVEYTSGTYGLERDALPLQVTVVNRGATPAGFDYNDLQLEVRLSQSDSSDANSSLVGTLPLTDLLSGGQQLVFSGDLDLPVNIDSAEYYLHVNLKTLDPSFAEYANLLSNNVFISNELDIEILALPRLDSDIVGFDTDKIYYPKETLTLDWNLLNIGLGDVPAGSSYTQSIELWAFPEGTTEFLISNAELVREMTSITASEYLPGDLSRNDASESVIEYQSILRLPNAAELLADLSVIAEGLEEEDVEVTENLGELGKFTFFFVIIRDTDLPQSSDLAVRYFPGERFKLTAVPDQQVLGDEFGTFLTYDVWREHNLAVFTEDSGLATLPEIPTSDPAGVGESGAQNLYHYALNLPLESADLLEPIATPNAYTKMGTYSEDGDDYGSLTFPIVRGAVDLKYVVEVSDNGGSDWSSLVVIEPPYLDNRGFFRAGYLGAQSLTSPAQTNSLINTEYFDGIGDSPVVSVVDQNYTAVVTVRDREVLVPGRVLRMRVEQSERILGVDLVLSEPGTGTPGDPSYVKGSDGIELIDPSAPLEPGDAVDVNFDIWNTGEVDIDSVRVQIRLVEDKTGSVETLDWSSADFGDIVLYDAVLPLDEVVGSSEYHVFRSGGGLLIPENVIATKDYFVAVWVDYLDDVEEFDEFNNLAFSASDSVGVTNSLTIPLAIDTDGTPSIVWSQFGDAPWYPVYSDPSGSAPVGALDNEAVRSPQLVEGQTAKLRTNFGSTPRRIEFDYYTQTSSPDSFLSVVAVAAGEVLFQASGDSAGWQTGTIIVPADAQVEFRYTQGTPLTADRVFLDHIVVGTDLSEPDFVLTGVDLTDESGEVIPSGSYVLEADPVYLSVSTYNQGTDSTTDFDIEVYLSKDSELDGADTLIRSYTEDQGEQFLSGNGAVNGFNIDLPTSLEAGSYYVIAVINPGEVVSEGGLIDNNVFVSAIPSVEVIRLPDLLITDFSAQPDYYVVEDVTRDFLDFEFRIENSGLSDVDGPLSIKILLSTDNIINPETDYVVLEYTFNGSLAQGSSQWVDPDSVEIRNNIPLGQYQFMGAFIDADAAIAESNEANNADFLFDNDFVFSLRTIEEGLDLDELTIPQPSLVILNDESAPYETDAQPWVVQSAESLDGVDAVTNVLIGDDESSSFSVEVSPSSDVRVSFWWMVSSQDDLEGRDELTFEVDGVEAVAPIFGTENTAWRRVEVPLSAGGHTLTWTYVKDDQKRSGQDRGWVDRLVISELPNLLVANVSLSSGEVYRPDGDSIDIWSVTVTNSGASAIEAGTAFDVAIRLIPTADWTASEAVTLLTITDTAGLAAGASRTYDQTSDGALDLPAGDYPNEFYDYAAYVDWSLSDTVNGQVTESFEDDNVRASGSASLQVGLPDVVASGVSGLAGPYGYGDSVSLDVALDNSGEGVLLAGSSFDLRVFLVPNQDPGVESGSQAYDLGTLSVGGSEVAAGIGLASQSFNATLPYGIANGSYYVGVRVDTGNDLVEQEGLSIASGDARDRADGEGNNLFFTSAAVFSVDNGISLAEALDQPALALATSGDGTWFSRDGDGDLSTADDNLSELFTSSDGDALQSPALAEGESASFSFVSPTSQLIRFDWATTGTSSSNVLSITVNGIERRSISGADQESDVEVLVSAGSTVRWIYTMGELVTGAAAYVDQLELVANNKPDLAITDLNYKAGEYVLDRGWAGSTLVNGEPQYLLTKYLDVSVTAENQGEELQLAAGAFTTADIEVRLSSNDVYGDEDDYILGSFAQVEGDFSGGNLLSFLGPIPLGDHIPEGFYYLMARIDPNNRVTEEFTIQNNLRISDQRDIQITRLPDLVIENLDGRPQGVIFDETLLVSDIIDVDETGAYFTNDSMRIRFNIQNVGLDSVDGSQEFITQVNMRGIRRPTVSNDPLGIDTLDGLAAIATDPVVLGEFPIQDELLGRSYDPVGGSYPGDSKAIDLDLLLPQAIYFQDVIADGTTVSDYLWFVELIVNRDFPIVESSTFNTWWCVDPVKLLDPIAPAVPSVDWFTEANGDTDDGLFGVDFSAPPTTEAEWETLYGVVADAGSANPAEVDNFMAYAFNRNPLDDDTLGGTRFPGTYGTTEVGGSDYLSISFEIVAWAKDLIYEVEVADDALFTVNQSILVTIDATPTGFVSPTGTGPNSLEGAGGLIDEPQVISVTDEGYSARVEIIDSQPIVSGGSRFMRVRVNSVNLSSVE